MKTLSLVQFLMLALIVGVPGLLLQLLLNWIHRKKLRRSSLWLTWESFQYELIRTLHHPHPESQELDRLLEKLQTFTVSGLSTISDEDRSKLIKLLKEKASDKNANDADRVRAKFLLTTMPEVRKKQLALQK